MGKVISLSAKLKKGKGSPAKGEYTPAVKSSAERIQQLELNMWTIVEYVEELEERVSSQERYLRKLLRLLQDF